MPYAAALLAAGAVVVAPDLTGLGVEGVRHPYLHGTTAGRAVLDAVRAAAAFDEAGARPVAALAGHSSGGHAVMWANQLPAEDDGGGLDVRSVVAIAPIGDLAVGMDHYATTAGHAAFAVQLAATWPGIEPVDAGSVLTAAAQRQCTVLDRACLSGVMDVYRGDPSKWIRASGFHSDGWTRALAEQSAGRAAGRARVVVVHGADDGSVLPAWSEQLVADIRLAGGDAELRRQRHADHNGVLDAARQEVVELLVHAIGLSRR
jgi:dipeptidyl aminopeptidase/acylaminoacyl peptidase